jgi:nucleoid-associated protein YgaU
MFTVQNDWIEYEEQAVPARRVAVRGGAACAQRMPVVRDPRTVSVPQRAAVRPAAVPAATARKAAVSRPRLRLTRRGRVVLVVLPALLALSGALIAAAPGVAEAAPRVAPRTVVVGTGDTLWTIAERIAPDTDPRTTVAAIERANGLASAQVDAGLALRLPAEG